MTQDNVARIFSGRLDWMFWPASRPDPRSAWIGHVPFAHWLVGAFRPRTMVELGTHMGVSYSAFCESVVRNRLGTVARAVDTWTGDSQAGFYGAGVFPELLAFHQPRYGGFSALLRKTFDEALADFPEKSIDLLHIDGFHTYEAVAHDFNTWKGKLSPRAVVLFHDTAERRPGFGVWQLWEELSQLYPAFAFTHSHGLGVLQVGADRSEGLAPLFAATPEERKIIAQRFQTLGSRLAGELLWPLADAEIRRLRGALQQATSARVGTP